MIPSTTEAILLRTRPLREADLILVYFTANHGKLIGVAAHARRSQRRFGGALAPGTIGTIAYRERPGTALTRIEEMRVRWSPMACARALPAFAALGVVLELVEATTAERQANMEQFTLLSAVLPDLATDPARALLAWCVRWLRAIGLGPRLDRCVRCGILCPVGAVARFVPHEGGIVCRDCQQHAGPMIELDGPDRRAWRAMEGGEPIDEASVGLREGIWRYLEHVAERPLKSTRYWEMVWQPPGG